MDFELSKEQQMLRARLDAFCRDHCTTEQMAALDRVAQYPKALHQAMADAGILGHSLPTVHGGNGGGFVDLAIIAEALSRSGNAPVNIFLINMIGANMIVMAGSQDQQMLLREVIEGRTRLAFALTEAGAGSDAAGIQSSARKTQDGYVIRGEKLYITGASVADFVLTVARTNPEAKAKTGTSLFLIPTDSPGLTIEPMEKLADNAVPSCRVSYDDVRVGSDMLLGDENAGWGHLMVGGGIERVIIAAASLGLAEEVLDEIIHFTTSREQYGQPVARFQSIQHQIADIATEIEAMRWLTYSAAHKADLGQTPIKEISMAKLYASERLNEIVNRGMRLLGGRAYLRENSMQRHLRESLLTLYAGGTVEIQRNLIARSLGLA